MNAHFKRTGLAVEFLRFAANAQGRSWPISTFATLQHYV
jgi:hypothetical protein